jgi:hypothetical protein
MRVMWLLIFISLSSWSQSGGTSIPPVDVIALEKQKLKQDPKKWWDEYIKLARMRENYCKGIYPAGNKLTTHDYILTSVFKKPNISDDAKYLVGEPCMECTNIKLIKCIYKESLAEKAQFIVSNPEASQFLVENQKLDKDLVKSFVEGLKSDLEWLKDE